MSQEIKSTEKIKIKEPPNNAVVNEAVVDCHQVDIYTVNLNSMAREHCWKKASQDGENKERSKEKPKHGTSNAPITEFQEEDTYTESMSSF